MPSLEGVSGGASRPHSTEFLESLTMQKRGGIRWSPLWRNRNYLLFQGGDIISGIGDSVQYLALSLLVLSLTGSPAQAGIVLGLSAIASIVFGLFAGALADRWDRKKIMIWCDIGEMALVGTIPVALWLGKLAMPQIYIVAGATSVFSTFFGAAATSALPNVTGPAQLIDGLRQGQAAGEVIRISGGVIGGSLFAIARAIPFATNALSFGVSAVTLRLIRTDFQESPDEEAAESAQDLWRDITAGLRWLWNHKLVRLVTLVTSADSLRYGAGYLVIVLLAKRLHTPAAGIGGIFAAAGVGALMGNVVAGWAEKRFTFGTVTLSMLWVEAIVFPLYAIAPSAVIIGLIAAVEEFVSPIYELMLGNYRMLAIPDSLRGRVGSSVQIATYGAQSVGAMASGFLIEWLGARRSAVVLGAWLVCLAIIVSMSKQVRSASLPKDDSEPNLAIPDPS
jgi:predicted MFS family arabinose efflux permease